MTIQLPLEEGISLRRMHLGRSRRIVVKVGSAVLTGSDGLNLEVMAGLAADINALFAEGREVILVSSGAVAAGRRRLGVNARALMLREKQAVAAVGQNTLMQAWEASFNPHGRRIAQLLLTHGDFSARDRYFNIRNTIFTLLSWGILPVINENDTVSVRELRFGDNDTLGAMLTSLIEADLFVCLTDVDGLYTDNPSANPEARPVYTVVDVDRSIEAMAGNVVGALGTGGMRSKILAAKNVAARGGGSIIGPGRAAAVLSRMFAGEALGTFFLPREEKLPSRKHWIAYTLRAKGSLVIDDGACRALREGGKSLLPAGVVDVLGQFAVGDPVECVGRAGEKIAAGLVNYSAADIRKIKGCRTSEIEQALGHRDSDEVIHRDNLVLV
ncbi:MAG: glutamate 5-kinase [Thermodesulfobacteriota bacterium]